MLQAAKNKQINDAFDTTPLYTFRISHSPHSFSKNDEQILLDAGGQEDTL